MAQTLVGTENLLAWNGKTPISVNDVAMYGQASLDIMNTSATIAVPITPSFTICPVVAAQQNIGYDPATGIITFLYTQPYVIVVMLNCNTSANRTVYGFAYINTQNGAGFVPIRYSGRQKQFNAGNDGQTNFQSANVFKAGWQLKLGNYASGAMNFVSSDLPGTTPGTLTVPAIRVLITG
jgi:hypothetical protein